MLISCMLHFSVPRARPVNLSFKLAAIVFNTGLFCTVFFKVYAPFFSTLWSSFQGRKRSYRFDVDGLSTRKWHIDVWENQHFSLNGMNCSWSITNLYVWIFFLSAVLLFAEKQPQMFFFLPDNVEKAGFVFHIDFFFSFLLKAHYNASFDLIWWTNVFFPLIFILLYLLPCCP